MSIRIAAYLAVSLLLFLGLAWQNNTSMTVTFYPGYAYNLNVAFLCALFFALGIASALLVLSFDTMAKFFRRLRKDGLAKEKSRVTDFYISAMEKEGAGDLDSAKKFFHKGLAHDPDYFPILLRLGSIQREQGAISEAIALHSRARGVNAKSIVAHLELAEDYMADRQYANAITILESALSFSSGSLPVLEKTRDIHILLLNWDRAAGVQERITKILPSAQKDEGKKVLANLIYERAVLTLSENNTAGAKEDLKTVLRNDPTFVPAYLKMAETGSIEGKENEIGKILEKGFEKTGSLVILKFYETWLITRGKVDKAAGVLRWARDLRPDEGIIRLLLVAVHIVSGNQQSARGELESVPEEHRHSTLYYLIEAELARVEGNSSMAFDSVREAISKEASSIFLFTCSSCGKTSREYLSRCQNCKTWNSLTPVLQ